MTEKIEDTVEAWESGQLGRDAAHAEPVSQEEQAADEALINEAFGLKPISIRLEVELLEGLKAIAKHRGLGYQPLMRQVLHRFVDSELKQIALEMLSEADGKEAKIEFPEMQKAA